jgi:hypothetical protein
MKRLDVRLNDEEEGAFMRLYQERLRIDPRAREVDVIRSLIRHAAESLDGTTIHVDPPSSRTR